MISLSELQAIFPKSKDKCELFHAPLVDAMREYDIDNPLRIAAFIAQCGHESMELKRTREIWGPTEQQKKYEPPTHKAAELGNIEPGDGYLYRGRGLIQLTGRANYRRCGEALDLDLVGYPAQLELPVAACRSAGWFWKTKGLNELADKPDFKLITKKINGGFNGWADRQRLYELAQEVLV